LAMQGMDSRLFTNIPQTVIYHTATVHFDGVDAISSIQLSL